MAKVNQRSRPFINTINEVVNQSYDGENDVLVVEPLGFDGSNLQRMLGDNLNYKVVTDGAITYVAMSAPGTTEATAKWQVFKVDTTSGVLVTYADGNANFDNSATDLASLF